MTTAEDIDTASSSVDDLLTTMSAIQEYMEDLQNDHDSGYADELQASLSTLSRQAEDLKTEVLAILDALVEKEES